jgi:hypothetical protein
LTPGQINVYYEVGQVSIGFGSIARNGSSEGRYPLSITANLDSSGLVENSSVGAVSDISLTPTSASNYRAAIGNPEDESQQRDGARRRGLVLPWV